MPNLMKELTGLLAEKGADLVGIGDMSAVPGCEFRRGIAVAVKLPQHVVRDLETAPTREYYDLYHALNSRLNEIVCAGEAFLKERGYRAWAQTTDRVKTNSEKISQLPHKTVATRAGLGWIGKNCLLVTPEFGSAIRLSSLLTDAPLECAKPQDSSKCGKCAICVEKCPAAALRGAIWQAGLSRDRILDFKTCYDKQLEIMAREVGIEVDLCGKCFAVCKYTQRYLKKPRLAPESCV